MVLHYEGGSTRKLKKLALFWLSSLWLPIVQCSNQFPATKAVAALKKL